MEDVSPILAPHEPPAPQEPDAPKPHVVQPLRPEEYHFLLSYAGSPAGFERWSSQFDRGQYMIRREAQFQGSLGNARRIQISRLVQGGRLPANFSENDNGRMFETIFDRNAGVVQLRQNRDEASQALTQEYHDPLSVVQLLRDLDPNVENLRVPMIGGTVLVTRLEDELLETPWGEVLAQAYYLRPGMGFIYIEADPPHRPLKFVQAIGRYVLESTISKSSESKTPENKSPRPQKRPERPRGRHKQQMAVQQSKPAKQPQPQKANPPRDPEGEPRNKRRRRNRRRGKGGTTEG
jgi:hypothetical protein